MNEIIVKSNYDVCNEKNTDQFELIRFVNLVDILIFQMLAKVRVEGYGNPHEYSVLIIG